MDWSMVIPVKRLTSAKSRLGIGAHASLAGELALAFAQDTVSAVLDTPGISRVIVVCDDARVAAVVRGLGAELISEPPGGGLNRAISRGTASVASGTAVASLPSDLPALRSAELAQALAAAEAYPRASVADATGVGTTLLCAGPGMAMDPRYGAASAYHHRLSGAVPLTGVWPTLRRDVDTVADLDAARALGLGPATRAVLGASAVASCP